MQVSKERNENLLPSNGLGVEGNRVANIPSNSDEANVNNKSSAGGSFGLVAYSSDSELEDTANY